MPLAGQKGATSAFKAPTNNKKLTQEDVKPEQQPTQGVYVPAEVPTQKTIFEEMFGPVLRSQVYTSSADEACDGKHTSEVLYGKKFVLIFFCSDHAEKHACKGPEFLPVLKKSIAEYEGADMEVVFVSDDRNVESFENYYGDMPWCAVPYDDARTRSKLVNQFGPQPFPLLVVLKDEGGKTKVVTDKGKGDLLNVNCEMKRAVEMWDMPM